MNPFKTYDYLVRARHRVFDWIRPLSPEQYALEFPIWRKSLGRTLTHILSSEWYYVQRIEQRAVPPYEEWPIREEEAPPFSTLEAAWNAQSGETRDALSRARDWSAEFEYRVTDDNGQVQVVSASAEDIFTQLVLHEVHHRAQVMNMLRQLEVAIDDLDFNAMMYKRRPL